jgi:putative restriction endonuclease
MFGGADSYVETLNQVLTFVQTTTPTTEELVSWHREQFARVSSRDSIMRRVRYLNQVGFLAQNGERWGLGDAGRTYVEENDTATLLRIMCERNVGLRSLLYALSVGPMSIEEISDQQLDTHPELGWTRGEADMAKQRTNWLRSMGLVEKRGTKFALTEDGREFVETAVEEWADTAADTEERDEFEAGTYQTVTYARSVDPEFRATVLSRYGEACPVSGVDHADLLDVAHILPWSEYPNARADLSNVLTLSKTHHAAFDRELFTIDPEYHIRVNPTFETESELLERTILNRAGEKLSLPHEAIDRDYLREYNQSLEWV